MSKHFLRYAAKKFLCLTLTVIMTAGCLVTAVSAASQEPAAETVSSGSAVELTCETGDLELVNDGRSIELHLCLTQKDELICQTVYREDIVLGGVFRDMFVSGVRNDKKTILLDLIGVPDLTGESENAPLQGTMEFPGAVFGCDDSVEAIAGVIEKEAPEAEMKPSFYPYLDRMRADGDAVELNIVLLPELGEFAGDFSAEDIRFARGLKDAKIKAFEDTGNGSRALTVSVPKVGIEDEDGYSCFGSIILSEDSMVSAGGKTYGQELCAVREYSVETVGRAATGQDDVNSMKNDVRAVKDFVDLFGDTSFATIAKTAYGGLSAVSAGYTVLSLVGILPSSSGNVKIMESLQNIQSTLNEVSAKCDYMTGVLDSHTKMITDMGVKLDEQYLGGFNAEFGSMVDAMDLLEDEIGNPWVKNQIEEAIGRVAEKYQTEQTGTGRDLAEDAEIVPTSEYLVCDYGAPPEDGFTGELADIDISEVMEAVPEDEEGDAAPPEEEAVSEEPEEISEAPEDADAGTEVPDESMPEEVTAEQPEKAAASEKSQLGGSRIIDKVKERIEDKKKDKDSSEEDEDTPEEEVQEERILDAYETQMYLMDLNREIGKIYLTANITIGDILRKIAAGYSSLSKRFDSNDNSNPIVAFCNAHEGIDNFATTSLAEKELYKQNIRYQLSRALTILSAMDSPTAYNRAITSLQNKDAQNTWPDVEKGTKDGKGNPYCYLMQGYVRLATHSEIEAWYDPLKNKKKEKVQVTNKSGQNVLIEEFYRRMQGRNLEQELKWAEITNLNAIREDGARGLTFSFERWGVNYGYRKFERSYYAWTDAVRLSDPDGVYDNALWGGQLLRNDGSYIIVGTPYIRWTAGLGDIPAEAYIYQEKGDEAVKYRLTTLVTP